MLLELARGQRWSELENGWLAAIEKPDVPRAQLLGVLDAAVKAGQSKLADSLGWAWLSLTKEGTSADAALELGRQLLVRLTDGEELREEILALYRAAHSDRPDLEAWIERSGLKAGKSVRRALRFLDVGLRLSPGTALLHRTEEQAARLESFDLDGAVATLRTARRTMETTLDGLIEDYDPVPEDDFRVLQQLEPERISKLLEEDPAAAAIGIVRSHHNKMSRDVLRAVLVPRYLPAEQWSDWWSSLRGAVKHSPHLRIEGRSPMFLIYDPAGQTPEQEAWRNFEKSRTPREWLELLEGYLRDTTKRRAQPDADFLGKVHRALLERSDRFLKHKEPTSAFATALVLDRVAADGLPVATADAHGRAVRMLSESADPVSMVASLPDLRLWPLALRCLEQAFPDSWAIHFGQLLPLAPAGQVDIIAKKLDAAGHVDRIHEAAERTLADPGRYTDALMWLWKGPEVSCPPQTPPPMEMLSLVLSLVGPARVSAGKAVGQSTLDMRAKVRAGLSAKSYGRFVECLHDIDEAMAQAVRRQVERAEGLGPSVQDDLLNIVRARFPSLYAKPVLNPWEDDSVLYFTAAGLARKEKDLDELVNVKMRENAKAIGEAASHGDLSENSEYKFALEERDLLRARVAKLNRELSMARVLERADIPTDHVSIGQTITLKPVSAGPLRQVTILGYDESDLARSTYSYHSPIARSLLGTRLGERVTLNLGESYDDYEVQSIEAAL